METVIRADSFHIPLKNDSVDSIVTDPPYGLEFMGKEWDSFSDNTNSALGGQSPANKKLGTPFPKRGKPIGGWCEKDRLFAKNNYYGFSLKWAVEALRVAKPGTFLLVFGGTRTFHRMAVAIEDAGWEIRDTIMWVYGSGFPKSRDIGKDIEKRNVGGIKNLEIIGERPGLNNEDGTHGFSYQQEYVPGKSIGGKQVQGTIPIYKITNEWKGWGTALKPAWEPIIVARKPLEGTVAENVMKYGTGAMNVDGCRIGEESTIRERGDSLSTSGWSSTNRSPVGGSLSGRWPANVIHDGSEEVEKLFPYSKSGAMLKSYEYKNSGFSLGKPSGSTKQIHEADEGSASRFFYCAKADRKDRDEGLDGFVGKSWKEQGFRDNESTHLSPRAGAGRISLLRNNHPTVKPTELMRYLCRLVTQPEGLVLDPFMGSGSTGKAAILEGFNFIGIDKDSSYLEIAKARIKYAEEVKSRTKIQEKLF